MQTSANAYAWKLAGLSKGLDINTVIQELERIESVYGSITPDIVLKASKPKSAVLHSYFEWNNTVAASHHRLQQARTLLNNIEVKIVSDGSPRKIAVYEVVKTNGSNQYKSIHTMTPNDVDFIKTRTLKELNILKDKLSTYKQFTSVIAKLNEAISELDKS
jgi:PP-loop superfamily ATP-utilizing enzyme